MHTDPTTTTSLDVLKTAKQVIKKNVAVVHEAIHSHPELAILGTSSCVYLLSRVAGFKAGYAFAKNPHA